MSLGEEGRLKYLGSKILTLEDLKEQIADYEEGPGTLLLHRKSRRYSLLERAER